MKNIYLIRHCKAEGQAHDAKLTDEGVRQAEKLIEVFAQIKVDLIYSSPYKRAIDTISPLAKFNNIDIISDERLVERVLTTVDNVDWLDMLKLSFEDIHLKFEGGESSFEAMNRMVDVVQHILKGDSNHILIVSHGNVIALLLKFYCDQFDFESWKGLTNPDIYQLSFSNSNNLKPTIKRIWQ